MIEQPRIPLPATTHLVGERRNIQVNHCRMPGCDNYGVRPGQNTVNQALQQVGTRTILLRAPSEAQFLLSVASPVATIRPSSLT